MLGTINTDSLKMLELVLFFGAALGFGIWQLVELKKLERARLSQDQKTPQESS
jgi:hypothetical protein